MKVHRYVSLMIRIVIGGLFVVAGTLKLLDINEFTWSIFQYGLVPQGLIPTVAVGLPVFEIAAGSAFMVSLRGSVSMMLGLLGMFIIVLTYGIMTDLVMECGCFPGEELAGGSGLKSALIRDVVLVFGVLYVYGYLRVRSRRDSEIVQEKI